MGAGLWSATVAGAVIASFPAEASSEIHELFLSPSDVDGAGVDGALLGSFSP